MGCCWVRGGVVAQLLGCWHWSVFSLLYSWWSAGSIKKKSNFKICRIQNKNKGRFDNLIKLKLPPTLTHFIFLASSPSKEKNFLFLIYHYIFYAGHWDERYHKQWGVTDRNPFERGVGKIKENKNREKNLCFGPLHPNISMHILHWLFLIVFLKCWQGEFV